MSAAEIALLRQALDHISRAAANSASSTRRIRWIQRRADMALRGEAYTDSAFDLPKVNPEAQDRLKRQLSHAKRLLSAHGIPWDSDPSAIPPDPHR